MCNHEVASCDPCHISIYSPGDQREITNTHSESPKEEFRVIELPQSGKIQPRIIDPIYPPITHSRSRLDSSHPGSKRLSLPSGLPRAALSIRGDGATPRREKGHFGTVDYGGTYVPWSPTVNCGGRESKNRHLPLWEPHRKHTGTHRKIFAPPVSDFNFGNTT